MISCPECKWNYPSDTYLSPMFVFNRYTQPICGICALEMTNRAHGIPRTEFFGAEAEELRQRAIRWRQNNPKYGPKTS